MQDVPSATEPDKLWQHYQKPPTAKWPADRVPMRRFEWNRLVHRLALPIEVKAVAAALALFGNVDGSSVVPTDPRIHQGLGLSDRQVRDHVAVLRGLKLLHTVKRAGGRTGFSLSVYQLTVPADSALPYRLDADYELIEEKPKGRAPVKAIEASKAARAARTQRNPASGETGPPASGDRNQASGETPAPGSDERNSASGESPTATQVERKPGSGQSAAAAPDERNPASAETPAASGIERKTSSGEMPVDNPDDRKAGSGESATDDGADRKPGSGETAFDRNASTVSPEAPHTLTGSRASDSVFNHKNQTPHVVSLGGDPPLGGSTDEQPEAAAPVHPEPPVDDPGAAAPGADPADPAYDDARAVLATVDPAELGDLLSDAQCELEAELAAGLDDGVHARADHRQIMIRAAQIVRRAEQLAGGR